MPDKKSPGRFTLHFNIQDPQQYRVAEILNQQGRMKAQFITSAVLHYLNSTETANMQSATCRVCGNELEQKVLTLLKKYFPHAEAEINTAFNTESPIPENKDPVPPATPDATFDSGELAAIYKTISAFKSK